MLFRSGLNSKLTASADHPLKMYVGDVEASGRMSQIMALEKQGKYYTFLDKENLEKQIPYLNKKYPSAASMAGLTVEQLFGKKLDSFALFEAYSLASTALINDGKGHFHPAPLPYQVQWSPVYAFALADLDGDGKADLLTGGDFFGTQPFEGRYDAMPLAIHHGDGHGDFKSVLPLPTDRKSVV